MCTAEIFWCRGVEKIGAGERQEPLEMMIDYTIDCVRMECEMTYNEMINYMMMDHTMCWK